MFNKRIILAATLLGGMLAAPAMAAGPQVCVTSNGYGKSHTSQRSCSWRGHAYAGTLTIDGYRTTIRSDRDVRHEFIRAFRRAGYSASYDRGSLVVRYRSCRPNIRWHADGYSARFSWQHGCVRISLINQSCNSCSGHRGGNSGGHGGHGGHGGQDHGYRDDNRGWRSRDSRRQWPTRRGTRGRCR
ncbi:MAG: hypothetical protein AB8F26_02125 [Phycisphaerales bacterium]